MASGLLLWQVTTLPQSLNSLLDLCHLTGSLEAQVVSATLSEGLSNTQNHFSYCSGMLRD